MDMDQHRPDIAYLISMHTCTDQWWIYYSSKLSMWEVLPYKDTDCTMVKTSDVGESWKFIMQANTAMQWNLYSLFLKGPCAETDKHRLTVAGQH